VLVFAHGIVGRADLPIPEAVFGAAAAAVLVVSFLALAVLWSEPRLQRVPERRLVRLPVAVDVVLGALGVLVLAVTAYAGLAGTEAERDNLAPWMVYVAFWVGVPFASLLLGDVWRLLSPWRAMARAAGWAAARLERGQMPDPLPYPERLGRWPAATGVIAFGICELCWVTAREPAPLAVLMLAYVVAMLVGMSLSASSRGPATPTPSASTSASSERSRRSRGATASCWRARRSPEPCRSTPASRERRPCCWPGSA